MTEPPEISGYCDKRFAAVREAFVRNFVEHDELGAAVSVTIEGEPVVDLWAGYLDVERKRPWPRDGIVAVWSVGKAVTAMAVLRLVDDGRVDLEAPVATYWPEFAQAGKEQLPVKYLLTHQAGMFAIEKALDPGVNLRSWETMAEALAEQAPWWPPGEGHGYHVNTIGFLGGEIVRRVDGRRLAQFVQDEFCEPLGVEFYMGTDEKDDVRTADWVAYKDKEGEAPLRPWLNEDPAKLTGLALGRLQAYRNPLQRPEWGPNSRIFRAAEYPSTNPHSNARSIARLFGALATDGKVDGVSVLSPGIIDRANTVEADGEDILLGRPTRFGVGFQLTIPEIRPFGTNPRSFGHYGNGAVLGFADPDARLGFGYVCNRAGRTWRDPRNNSLIDATYGAL